MKPNPVVLLIDPDRGTRRLLRTVLESQHYKVFEAEDGETGTREAVARRPDVVILDLCLPDVDGLVVLKRFREWNRVPVLILSADDAEEKIVAALDSGAGDYMSKPFGIPELLARLRVLQRPIPGQSDGPFYINCDLHVDITARVATIRGRQVDFSPTEEALFFALVRHAGQLVTRKHLLRCIWGTDSESKLHDLHVYVGTLRKKLQDASDEILIRTEGSIGYWLVVPFKPSNSKPAGHAGEIEGVNRREAVTNLTDS